MKRTVVVLFALLASTVFLSTVATADIIGSRFQAESTVLPPSHVSINDDLNDDGTHIRFSGSAVVADIASQPINPSVPVDEIRLTGRLNGSGVGDDELAVYLDGLASSDKIGTVLFDKGSTYVTKTITLSTPISAGSHTLSFGPNQTNDSFMALDYFEIHNTGSVSEPSSGHFTSKVQGEAMSYATPIVEQDQSLDDGSHIDWGFSAPFSAKASTSINFPNNVETMILSLRGVNGTEDMGIFLDGTASGNMIGKVDNLSNGIFKEFPVDVDDIPAGSHTVYFGPAQAETSAERLRLDYAVFEGSENATPVDEVTASHDSWVVLNQSRIHGTENNLRTCAGCNSTNNEEVYVQFDTDIPNDASDVQLAFEVTDASTRLPEVNHNASATIDEDTLTYSNRPSNSGDSVLQAGVAGSTSVGDTVRFDVDSVKSDNDGHILFHIKQLNTSDAIWFGSKDAIDTADPRLEITGGTSPSDTTDPDTSITSSAVGTTSDSTPTFTFTGSDDTGVTGFECRVYRQGGASGEFSSCSSPYTTAALSDGAYTFEVRAADAAGNVDQEPASENFTISTPSSGQTVPYKVQAETGTLSGGTVLNTGDPDDEGDSIRWPGSSTTTATLTFSDIQFSSDVNSIRLRAKAALGTEDFAIQVNNDTPAVEGNVPITWSTLNEPISIPANTPVDVTIRSNTNMTANDRLWLDWVEFRNTATAPTDTDSDGVPDASDNCPSTANANQADLDNDGQGDVCDNDRDGDGVGNSNDYDPDDPNVQSPPSTPTGDTPGIGTGSSSACDKTIQPGTRTLENSPSGLPSSFGGSNYTICLRGGVYGGLGVEQKFDGDGKSNTSRLIVKSYPGEKAQIRGQLTWPNASYVTLRDMYFDNRYQAYSPGGGKTNDGNPDMTPVILYGGSHVNFTNNWVDGGNRDATRASGTRPFNERSTCVGYRNPNDDHFTHSWVSNCGVLAKYSSSGDPDGHGIYFSNASGATPHEFSDNALWGIPANAIDLHGMKVGPTDYEVEGNLVFNSSNAVDFNNQNEGTDLHNNLLIDPDGTPIRYDKSQGGTKIRENCLNGNIDTNSSSGLTTSNNVTDNNASVTGTPDKSNFSVSASSGCKAKYNGPWLPSAGGGDSTAPTVTVNSGPGDTSDGSANFTFSANESSTFECKLATQAGTIINNYAACSSPKVYSSLANGTYTFSVRATDATGNVSSAATQNFTVTLGGTSTGTATIVGAGDIGEDQSGGAAKSAATGNLVKTELNNGAKSVFTLGDNAYPDGAFADYKNNYDPGWGGFKSKTYPVYGNHEYIASDTASGTAQYFNGSPATPVNLSNSKSYYAYSVPNTKWRVLVLNSAESEPPSGNQAPSCSSGSAQYNFALNELQTDQANGKNVVMMWHHSRFSNGGSHSSDSSGCTKTFFDMGYDNGADLVLNAHSHLWERFSSRSKTGAVVSGGLTQITVGTGGGDTDSINSSKDPNPDKVINNTWGIARLVLGPNDAKVSYIHAPNASGTDTVTVPVR